MSGSIFTASIFTGVHDFFHSATWHAVSLGLVALVLLFWLATVYWVNKDARRRIEQPSLVALATLIGAIPPFLGPLIYMLFRPPEYLEDVRERELEIRAIESRLGPPRAEMQGLRRARSSPTSSSARSARRSSGRRARSATGRSSPPGRCARTARLPFPSRRRFRSRRRCAARRPRAARQQEQLACATAWPSSGH